MTQPDPPTGDSSTDDPDPAKPSSARPAGKGSLLVIFLTVFIDLLGFALVLPLLPLYAEQFTVDDSGMMIGLLMASFSIMQFIFAPLWGRLSDRIGRRPVLMIGLLGSVIFYTLFGLTTSLFNAGVLSASGCLAMLFVTRIGAGIAGATISTAQAYIADTTTLEKRSKGMALIGMAFGMGFTFGPLVGCLAVINSDGNPGPLPGYVAAALSAIALTLAAFLLPESLADNAKAESGHRMLDLNGFREAFATPSIGLVLVAIFVCIFSFGNFETTLSLLIKGKDKTTAELVEEATDDNAEESASSTPKKDDADATGPFHFTFVQVCLTYTFIGFMLSLVQGLIVRRLSGKVPDGISCAVGAVLEIIGFTLMVFATTRANVNLLFIALSVVVTGFSIMQPNLNAMLSRRSDPAKQGMMLGVGQSVSSLARILGPLIGVPLYYSANHLPYCVAAGLMVLGLLLVIGAASRGRDYAVAEA